MTTSVGCQLPISTHKRGKRTMRKVVRTHQSEDAVEAKLTHPEQRRIEAVVDLESDKDITKLKESDEYVGYVKEPSPEKHGDSEADQSDAFEEARSKAMTAVRERKFKEALEHFSQAISIRPTSSLMYCARANLCNKLGNFEAAIDDSTVALQITPSSTRARDSLKLAYEMLGLPLLEEDELPSMNEDELASMNAEKRQIKKKRPYSP